MSLKIEDHKNSKRVKVIKIPEADLDRLGAMAGILVRKFLTAPREAARS